MREILFRGKRIDNGEWVYGNLNILNGRIYHIVPLQVYIHTSGIPASEFYDVDPSTVGQFTGLTDKNGKKIFEGDVVKISGVYWTGKHFENERVGDVYFYNGTYYIGQWELCRQSERTLEIIGNIHDNPELLGGDKK